MKPWISRGLALAAAMIGVRFVLGLLLEAWPLHSTAFRIAGLIIFAAAAGAYGALDGRRDRRANVDPDHGEDLTMRWLAAGFCAGVVAGCLASLLGTITPVDLGHNSLFFEITSGAAWTMLLVFVSSAVGIAIGRRTEVLRLRPRARVSHARG